MATKKNADNARIKAAAQKAATRDLYDRFYEFTWDLRLTYHTEDIEEKLNKLITRMEGVAEHTGSAAFIRDLNELRSLRAMIRKEASKNEAAAHSLFNWISDLINDE